MTTKIPEGEVTGQSRRAVKPEAPPSWTRAIPNFLELRKPEVRNSFSTNYGK